MNDHLARIGAREREVKAFIDFDAERALMLARAADQHQKRDPPWCAVRCKGYY